MPTGIVACEVAPHTQRPPSARANGGRCVVGVRGQGSGVRGQGSGGGGRVLGIGYWGQGLVRAHQKSA
ncbi:MAG: hypothetical protein EI684_19910 [Candidatus Viridilinea halotolerans]|uniref:Uncharacterized protein n=1 Tax=Candidatus Viridilinea halotolerans TaxID=2491704 RepID=A0A426TSE6_9CHLR|nr:MAG: hypothetical protein EI684_19910 [Candidatus Viridilinea halotolerans]